jgi:hypothetical protein
MEPYRHALHIKTLWVLILIGIAFSGLLHYQRTLTGMNEVDGIIGVLLGLYICSHPAANVVDMLFFRKGARRLFLSRQLGFLWLALNMLVLMIGWIVIFIGTTRFLSKID